MDTNTTFSHEVSTTAAVTPLVGFQNTIHNCFSFFGVGGGGKRNEEFSSRSCDKFGILLFPGKTLKGAVCSVCVRGGRQM